MGNLATKGTVSNLYICKGQSGVYVAAAESYTTLIERTSWTDFEGYQLLRDPHTVVEVPLLKTPNVSALLRLANRHHPDRVNRLKSGRAVPVSVFTEAGKLLDTFPSGRALQRSGRISGWRANVSAHAWGGYHYGPERLVILYGNPK